MKFEKLSDNKIQITLTIQDLVEKDIDFHVFMSNPIESQHILLDMLEEAKKETGFDPEDSNLKVEALSMADTNFIFTITKIDTDEKTKLSKKKFTVKRKNVTASSQSVYCFNQFDDYCNFLAFLNNGNLLVDAKNIAKSITLYEYKEKYYLILNNANTEFIDKIKLYACITEFAKCVNSNAFSSKLKECGNLIMKNNALEIGFNYFVSEKNSL